MLTRPETGGRDESDDALELPHPRHSGNRTFLPLPLGTPSHSLQVGSGETTMCAIHVVDSARFRVWIWYIPVMAILF